MNTVRIRRRMKRSAGSWIFDVFNYTFMVLFCLSILFPFWNMLVTSLSRAEDVSVVNLNLWPKAWSFEAYSYCLNTPLLGTAFKNSLIRTLLGTAYHLLICCLAAFALTRHEMPYRKFFTVLFLITMFFSGGLIPTYLNIKNLGLLDNFWVYVLPAGFSMYNTIVIRNYFLSIDRALEEAATIDGCSSIQVMLRIILPLSSPVLATVGLWQIVGHWNSWFDNMIYVRPEGLITLQYYLRRMSVNIAQLQDEMTMAGIGVEQAVSYTPETIIAATTVIILVPIIVVYPFLQKYFVKGIMTGAVKG